MTVTIDRYGTAGERMVRIDGKPSDWRVRKGTRAGIRTSWLVRCEGQPHHTRWVYSHADAIAHIRQALEGPPQMTLGLDAETAH